MRIEQRDNLRASLCLGAELQIGQKQFVGYTENISLSGALIASETFCQDPELVDCEGQIWLAVAEEFEEFKCRIIHVSQQGIGIKFLHQDNVSADCLRQLITNAL